MPTGFIYSDRFLEHDTGRHHPERAARLTAIMDGLCSRHLLSEMTALPFGPAELGWVEAVHQPAYVERLRLACQGGQEHIDTVDSAICPASYDVALLAAGGAVAAADAVVTGKVRNAFCAVRPPGHHAEADRSMGFCLFNNVAIAAQRLISAHGLKRVAILDFDVHHGNGTQHIFEGRRDVFYISIHEHPTLCYPGTGFPGETGTDEGQGFTMNLPLSPPAGDAEYRQLILKRVMPALDLYQPQALLLSAGFDACKGDPLAHLELSPQGFQWMTRELKAGAERWCDGRIVSVLEGGYDLRNLAECVCLHVGVLLEPAGHDGMMGMKAGL